MSDTLDLDAIERRANKQRATDEDLLDLVAEVRRLSAQRDLLRSTVNAALALVVKYAEPGRRRKQLAGAVPVDELHRVLDTTEEHGDGQN